MPGGTSTAVTLDADQEEQYLGHREKVIRIISGDDEFSYAMHQALYAM
ncbi:hypothetical protein ACF073_35555 [Streptomyces sp. NPDC015171]